jgi:CheY-like chemotaxis protein
MQRWRRARCSSLSLNWNLMASGAVALWCMAEQPHLPTADNGAVSAAQHPMNATVLVVEDEVLTRVAACEELRDRGYVVIEAVSADEALSVLRSPVQVHLVLTDLRMPGAMDGAALVKRIRAEFPFLKVVMVSGQLPDPAIRALLDGYFPKPVALSQVAIFLQQLMTSARVN